jgi:hypothetical protein
MQVIIVGVNAGDLDEVYRLGLHHPVVGGLLDGGSYASVRFSEP